MANRLTKAVGVTPKITNVTVGSVVSIEQYAFVKGHEILNGSLIMNAIVDWYKIIREETVN